MKLWIVRAPIKDGHQEHGPWSPYYDKLAGVIVRAETEHRARELAATKAGEEGKGAWTTPWVSECFEVEQAGEEEVLLQDYRAG